MSLALAPGCGRLAYEKVLPRRAAVDAGNERVDASVSEPDGGPQTPVDASAITQSLSASSSAQRADQSSLDSNDTFTPIAPTGETTPAPNGSESDAPETTGTLATSRPTGDAHETSTSPPSSAAASTESDGLETTGTLAASRPTGDAPETSTSPPSSAAASTDTLDSPGSSDSAPCTTPGAFLAPVALTGLPSPAFSPSLSVDRLTLYFAVQGELYTAVRANADSLDFTQVTALTAINTTASELTPQLSRDGLRLYFARGDDPQRDLYVATRATTAAPFTSVAALSAVNTPYFGELLPRESPDGRELFFTSLRGATLFDVWVTRRNDVSDPYGSAAIVSELTSNADETPGGLSNSGLMMMLASKRTGTLGGQDLWTTTRADTNSSFGEVLNEAILNTSFNELDPTLSADDLELLFASDRSGDTLIYRSSRECLP